MKWKNHASIAKAISRELELPIALEQALVQGSIDPDIYPDLMRCDRSAVDWKRVAHHSPTTSLIMDYVWRARRCLLMGENSAGFFNLGRALHYLQDRTVGFSSQGQHDRKERVIGGLEIDHQAISSGLRDAVSHPRYVKGLIRGIRPTNRAGRSMRNACYISAALAASVVGKGEASDCLANNARRSKGVNIILVTSMLILISFWVYDYLEAKELKSLGLALVAASLAIISSTFRSRRMEVNRWFGLE